MLTVRNILAGERLYNVGMSTRTRNITRPGRPASGKALRSGARRAARRSGRRKAAARHRSLPPLLLAVVTMTASALPGLQILAGYCSGPRRKTFLPLCVTCCGRRRPIPAHAAQWPAVVVRMSNCGPLGWVSDQAGYRYQATHPETGLPWRPCRTCLLTLWTRLARYRHPPQACLVNLYAAGARLGLHQDRDEQISTRRWCLCRSATPACFASGERAWRSDTRLASGIRRCAGARWPARSPSTASIALCRARRRCCRKRGDQSDIAARDASVSGRRRHNFTR